MDWNNPKNDRARAAYDNFQPLDGTVRRQRRSSRSSTARLISRCASRHRRSSARSRHTNQAIELQITQEYIGQARHTVFLAPMWKEALDFDMHVGGAGHAGEGARRGQDVPPAAGRIRRRVERRARRQLVRQSSVAGESVRLRPPRVEPRPHVGYGSPTSGRGSRSATIRASCETVTAFSSTRGAPTSTTPGPLGLQTLTDIVGNHYGVAVEASERNGWGQWHRADDKGVGMDRTVATGTGYIGQYSPAGARDVRDRSRPVPTICCCSCTTCRTRTCCTRERRSSSTSTIRTTRAPTRSQRSCAMEGARRRGRRASASAPCARSSITRRGRRSSGATRSRVVPRDVGHRGREGPRGQLSGRIEARSHARLTGYVVKDVTPWETASGERARPAPPGRARRHSPSPAHRHARHRGSVFRREYRRARSACASAAVVGEWTAGDACPRGSSTALPRRAVCRHRRALRLGGRYRDRRVARRRRKRRRSTTSKVRPPPPAR